MDFQIASILAQDGAVNGAIYALIALALVLTFSVTRVIFVPQGEFVTYGALTLALLQTGRVPATFWLLLAMTGWAAAAMVAAWMATPARTIAGFLSQLAILTAPTGVAAILLFVVDAPRAGFAVQVLTTLFVVVPLGPLLYRTIYAPIAHYSVLLLLIVSVAVHLAMVGFGLSFFGAEGFRTPPLIPFDVSFAGLSFTGSEASIFAVTALVMVALALLFALTTFGKALRAMASNRIGARIVGIRPERGGSMAFTLAALLGVVSGLLIGPVTTLYYDTGFFIALKGFVAAIIGNLTSFPLAVAGALFVGLTESYASFFASAFKEAIVFFLVLPVLLWLSLQHNYSEE
ncbi:MAG TPA: branched-chain amino acid ABC transporter permease [Xanthobacteraceae bacterium]|jgi:branched-chain amino acid transport system permease protein|uniref:branched-chain amino acid ABC transporter permease n=1 Tax=Roseixanthobacter finlandensis TaxID=3119922 RepID=UPI002BA3388C|nr:branched-chain amino acid ABC transporter permease [Xanthobacteraceae bacterium]HQS47012.1 branched-chain amino acid ABC transporter permease [Xanthobacteraceae bacterium]